MYKLLKGEVFFMFIELFLSPLCALQFTLHFTCSDKEIMLYLITPVNINVIMRLKRDTHLDSTPNIDLTNSAFFSFLNLLYFIYVLLIRLKPVILQFLAYT